MLRSPRRDRFAPHLPLERERREAAFANADDRKPITVSEQGENIHAQGSGKESRYDTVASIAVDTRKNVEHITAPEDGERLLQSSAFTDALGEIAHPTEMIARAVSQRESTSAEERANTLQEVLKDPASLIAVTRAMESQRQRHLSFIETVERTAVSGTKIGPNMSVRDTLSRADAAESIRQLSKVGGYASMEQWVSEAKPRELERLLGIADRSSAMRRFVGLIQDQWKRLTFRSSAWAESHTDLSPNELKAKQENYFSLVDRNIVTLKTLLGKELARRADALTQRITTAVEQGLSHIAGRDIRAASMEAEAWNALDREKIQKNLGVTLEDIFEQYNTAARLTKRMRGHQIHAANFVESAESYLQECSDLEKDVRWEGAVAAAQERHREVEADIQEFLSVYDEIRPKILRDPRAQAMLASIAGAKEPQDAVKQLEDFAQMLKNPSAADRSELRYAPKALQIAYTLRELLQREAHVVLPSSSDAQAGERISAQAEKVLARITQTEKLLQESRIQQSFTCKIIGITGKLAEQMSAGRAHVRKAMLSCDSEQASTEQKRSAAMQIAVVEYQMTEIGKALQFIKTSIPASPQATTKPCRGYCDYGSTTYFVNPDRHRVPPPQGPINAGDVARTADHEFGHLVMDTLTERTQCLSSHFEKSERRFREAAVPQLQDVETVLESAAAAWGMDRAAIEQDGDAIHAAGGADAYYRRKRWEELLMKYATYRSKADTLGEEYDLDQDPEFPSPDERKLLRLLDEERAPQLAPEGTKGFLAAKDATEARKALAFHGGADADPFASAQDDVEGEHAESTQVVGPNIEDFKDLRSLIQFVGNFIETYPEAKGGWIGAAYEDAKLGYERTFRQFNEGVDARTGVKKPGWYRPEDDRDLKRMLDDAKAVLKGVKGQIEKFDAQNLQGIAEAEPQGKEFWLWFTRDIQWLSIMDYWTIAKESWEDLSRLWKRRGENARGKVGELLTGWIGDRVPYLGQLKHEFHRRQQDSELSAVDMWKKALANVDSYKLIEDIEHVNNPDHLKAIIILLTERGRLVWEDEKILTALNRFSHFKIPIAECHRDPVLLEKWLQKIIADIWSDKDLYRQWKTTNEHHYDSERDKFNGVADFMSVGGKLSSELEYLLRTYVEAVKAKKPIPDQVNPHYYEKLFLYAMENGKMTMQDKFFFLVQGIRYKLIPLDRLSILQGKVAMEGFPFIDFFYQQNNSMQDIMEIGESITEDPPASPFKPGLKSVAFLMEEVARDEATRVRVSKYMDRKGDQLDHEDVPMFVSFVGYEEMNNMLQPMGGQKQRFTKEGIKNAYVGYNTLFKVNAMKIKRMLERGKRPSSEDLQYLVSRLVTYIHFNNVVLRNAAEVSGRPSLSPEAYENETMPSAYTGLKPKDYGTPMNTLVDKLLGVYPVSATDIGVDMNKYLGKRATSGDGERDLSYSFEKAGSEAKEVFHASRKMYTSLLRAVMSDNGAGLIQVLTDMDDAFINEGRSKFSYEEMHGNLDRLSKRYAGVPSSTATAA